MSERKNVIETNWDEYECPPNDTAVPTVEHQIHMEARDFCKHCESEGIPVFLSYYLPKKGYKYRAVFPEEIDSADIVSEYGKFKQFLRVCIGFNKEQYYPTPKK